MDSSNTIHQLMILEHLEATRNIRAVVAKELKSLIADEKDTDKRILFQSAVDLLEFNKLMAVHLSDNSSNFLKNKA